MAHDHLTDPNMPDDLRALAARVEAGEDPDEVHGIERLWLYRVERDKDAWGRAQIAFLAMSDLLLQMLKEGTSMERSAADEITRLRAELGASQAETERLRELLKHADDVTIWEHNMQVRQGFQEEIEAAFGIGATLYYEHGVPSKTSWPRAQEEARKADPRPSEAIMRQERGDWPDATIGTEEEK